jgi:hypothetical protein
MKKLLSFFLSPLKVLGKATFTLSGFVVTTPAKVAKAGLPTALPRAMLLVYELVPRRSGA